MTNNKNFFCLIQNIRSSPGPGGIPVELLKHATIRAFEILAYIFNRCLFMHDKIPQDWKLGFLTPIHKKGPRDDCANYRGITVLATIGRLYGRIIRKRIEKEIDIGEEQSGFTAGRSCIDNMFTLKQLIEKRKLVNLETHLIFIDLEKAFDTVPIQKLIEILDKSAINKHFLCAINEIYKEQANIIKISNKVSTPFRTDKGVRQGCCLSPTLFKIYLEHILTDWKKKCEYMGIPIHDNHIYSLLFADDQVIMAGDEHDIHYMIRKLAETYEKNGMKINFKKTKYLVSGGTARDLEVGGQTVAKCEEYKYLGSVIASESNSKKEITSRIGQARQATQTLNSILWSKYIKNETKIRIYHSIVQSILLYGSDTWELTKRDKQRINAVEMDFLRRSCRVSRMDRIRNLEIRERIGKLDTTIEQIEKKRLIWFGHTQRMREERWPKKVLNWNPPGRRKRGRPPELWHKQVHDDMTERNLVDGDWLDRKRWHMGCEKRLEL